MRSTLRQDRRNKNVSSLSEKVRKRCKSNAYSNTLSSQEVSYRYFDFFCGLVVKKTYELLHNGTTKIVISGILA